jgi:hypothetical protein
MPRYLGLIAALALLSACGRRIDGVLYTSTEAKGKTLANREILVVPAGKVGSALDKFCADQKKVAARSDSFRVTLEGRSRQLAVDAARERARNGPSHKWYQLITLSGAVADSSRAVPYETLASTFPVAKKLAVARGRTNGAGEFHIAGVPIGRHRLFAVGDDDWGDVILVGPFRPTKVDLGLDEALPGCFLADELHH